MALEADGSASCSIEETNEIRRKLGLKPLLLEDPEKPLKKAEKQETETILERLDLIKRRRIRDSLVTGDSIAESIKKGQQIISKKQHRDENYEEIDPLNLTAWANKMSSINASRINHLENTVTYSDDEEDNKDKLPSEKEDDVTQPKIKILHKVDELDLLTDQEITLTLKDIGVLEAESAGIADIDFLENSKIAELKKQGEKVNKSSDYIPYEDDGNLDDSAPNFLNHYDDVIKDRQGLKLSSLASDNNGFFVSIDDLVASTIEIGGNEREKHDLLNYTSFKNIDRKKKLIKNRQKPINWNRIFTREEHSKDDGVEFVAPKKIKKNIQPGTEFDDTEDCNRLYNQLSCHIRRSVKSDRIPLSPDKASLIDIKPEDSGFEITSTSEFCKSVKTPLEKVEENEASSKWKSTISYETGTSKDGSEKDLSFISEKPMGNGLADALSYIKDRGDFVSKNNEYEKDIVNLTKLDSYGRTMTPKEEFRQLSWVFHGKGPGMNKRDRKIRRMERERLARENPIEGLPTMKALLAHQSNQETTHLILTGNNVS
ncbi:hypothetical protein BEWA_009560 [Theileria equi strain WA]|uniref:SART-1 family protein n=1 Tax=Theileria equi strain WA TaxID=1537102 RepID=L0B103_THEEQ|nr:hypothetical protein BEWA_009560 [Theileria equi strain WA]AFZ81542.1 hypothetical protein BEWA_009560 [Theileria equi strain WA]|eukprot:XP_004831208.1 hypothetical protein BEWA_009560 [Theileria equi strain WA]